MIKVMDCDEVVSFDVANLPDNAEELLDVLTAEAAPFKVWFDFARAYLAQGNEDAFKSICEQGTRADIVADVRRNLNNVNLFFHAPCNL